MVNETSYVDLILREGTMEMLRIVAELKLKKPYYISIDLNATYREYRINLIGDGQHYVALTSDDY